MAWRFKEMLMGIIRAHLRLANDAKPELEEIDADALVATTAETKQAKRSARDKVLVGA